MDPSRQSMEVRVREVRSGMHPSRFSLRPLSALFPARSFSPRHPLDSHRRFLTHLTQMRQKGCGRLDEDSPSLNTGGMRRSATTRQGNTGGMRRSATTRQDSTGGMRRSATKTRQHRWHAEECDDNKTTQVACGGVRRRPDNTGGMRRSATTRPDNTGGMRRSATTPLPPNISDITASDVSEISAVCCPSRCGE